MRIFLEEIALGGAAGRGGLAGASSRNDFGSDDANSDDLHLKFSLGGPAWAVRCDRVTTAVTGVEARVRRDAVYEQEQL
ncbi:hypothetical protein EVAR_27707_1 [Eumeta japonica]|uniref:Uncharacterized protein n=1 Tax=Eumeta variegata TaxID=151549 RepID=A0A4C1WRM3_EUMVA|nr:hypothetical protein EVAR_27707_1 [Eumeta japonica]